MKKNFRIGEIAKIKNIDSQTLRYYDKMGVLCPKIVDTENGYRYYTLDQFMEVDKIKFYKKLGLSLDEIKKFKEIENLDEALKTLKSQKDEFEKEILKMQVLYKNIQSIIDKIEDTKVNNETHKTKIMVKDCNSIYGVIRKCKTVNDWYDFENELLQLTKGYPNYSEIGHNHGISIIYDKKYLYSKAPKYMKKILLPIDKAFINYPNVEKYHLGKCIIAYHKGSYDTMEDTFSEIADFINKEGLQIRGDIIETDIVGSFIVHNEDEFLVQLTIPILS